MKPGLIVLFILIAALYASVGFGGGSSYSALLALFGVNYLLIPIISLACNILVVSGNTVRYSRAGAYNWGEIWPFLILSIPCAWLGGRISIPEHIFTGLLALALFIAGLILLFGHNLDKDRPTHNAPALNAAIGAGLGFVSGLVGIGGGIFLAPILHLINWGKPKHIAALCSLFILVNSVAGLGGQMVKFLSAYTVSDLFPYLPLALAVLTGGYIGNRLGLNVFSQNTVNKLTAVLILFVASRLLWQVYAAY